MAKETILYATRVGQPDWCEEIITTNESRIEQASAWALENGFDRLRVAVIDMGGHPDFGNPEFMKEIKRKR